MVSYCRSFILLLKLKRVTYWTDRELIRFSPWRGCQVLWGRCMDNQARCRLIKFLISFAVSSALLPLNVYAQTNIGVVRQPLTAGGPADRSKRPYAAFLTLHFKNGMAVVAPAPLYRLLSFSPPRIVLYVLKALTRKSTETSFRGSRAGAAPTDGPAFGLMLPSTQPPIRLRRTADDPKFPQIQIGNNPGGRRRRRSSRKARTYMSHRRTSCYFRHVGFHRRKR